MNMHDLSKYLYISTSTTNSTMHELTSYYNQITLRISSLQIHEPIGLMMALPTHHGTHFQQ
jgi:hypothetical protein